jgi:hypothetical protein
LIVQQHRTPDSIRAAVHDHAVQRVQSMHGHQRTGLPRGSPSVPRQCGGRGVKNMKTAKACKPPALLANERDDDAPQQITFG